MKTDRLHEPLRHGVVLFSVFLIASVGAALAQLESPVITSIRPDGTNVLVVARVPAGIRRLTLEGCERLAGRSWEPRAVARLDGSGGQVTFRLPHSRQLEVLRVRGDATEPLPGSFFEGTNSFLGQPGSAGPTIFGAQPGDTRGGTPPATAASRDVVESDIWKFRGQTLYFFNQYRGLQIIDVTHPDAAFVRGMLELPAAGEQMYLLASNHVVLLAHDGCAYDQAQVLIVADTNGPPAIVAQVPVSGYIQESRMVGTALYVASQTYRPVPSTTNSTWEWGTLVSAFDLSAPESPVTRGTLWYPGYGNVVAATDRLLFVVTQDPANWWQSIVRSIDITEPDGMMRAYESIRTAGRVPDKFKLNWENGIFTSISEDWHGNTGPRLVTKLETFRLPDPRSLGPAGVVKLGELELGRGEQLHATRFDGDRVYVVTFFRIDPLWVVNFADPAHPRVAGSVDVPGWSTYIQPLDGGRLVTVGVVSNRVAVSLFDVQNATAPALLSRVLLGQNYSWTEANSNEKAFSVLPEAGLLLVPFSGDTTNGYTSRVQLIGLTATSLIVRGAIEHQFQPRRAALYNDRILSISGQELLSVDPSDRDHPLVRGVTELAWPVDRVFLHGPFLLELATTTWWGGQSPPVLRVAPFGTPNDVLNRLTLANLPVLGATLRGDRFYLAQGNPPWLYPLPGPDGGGTVSNSATLRVTIIGLADLPALTVLGQVESPIDSLGWPGDLQAVWPKPDVLVWASSDGGSFGLRGGPGGGPAPTLGIPWPFFWGGGGQLLAFDVSDPASPKFASEINLGTNNWWSFSPPFSTDGLVYMSHQITEFFIGLLSPWQTTATDNGPIGTWLQNSYLDVIDYANPRDPLVRTPVSLPGTLHGLSHQGALLYTVGPRWTTNWLAPWTEYLEASAYDGVAAHLVDSLALPVQWPHPTLVVETNIFIGRPGDNPTSGDVGPNTLETWALSGTGKFTRLGSRTLAKPANVLANFHGMLALQETDNSLDLFDATAPAALRPIGRQAQPNGCWWYDLSHADGDVARGLWIPLGAYGVTVVPVSP